MLVGTDADADADDADADGEAEAAGDVDVYTDGEEDALVGCDVPAYDDALAEEDTPREADGEADTPEAVCPAGVGAVGEDD